MKIPDNTIFSAVSYFREELLEHYDVSELDQMLFITFKHYFGLNRIDLSMDKDKLLSESDLLKIIYAVKALKKNKPLAQILGEWEFFDLRLNVNEHTLIPRPETEELVQLILDENKNARSLLDIGTGTGCIALSLKKNIPDAEVSAYDVSIEALEIARSNSVLNKLEVSFKQLDILNWNEGSTSKYDVIVSNPPYITLKEKEVMNANVLDFEPHLALFVEDEEPLLFYEAIANYALNHLNKNGRLYFEINEHFGNEVKQLLIDKNYKNVNIVKDLNGKERIVSCILE